LDLILPSEQGYRGTPLAAQKSPSHKSLHSGRLQSPFGTWHNHILSVIISILDGFNNAVRIESQGTAPILQKSPSHKSLQSSRLQSPFGIISIEVFLYPSPSKSPLKNEAEKVAPGFYLRKFQHPGPGAVFLPLLLTPARPRARGCFFAAFAYPAPRDVSFLHPGNHRLPGGTVARVTVPPRHLYLRRGPIEVET
jgi:hypothetical protein